jgi:hypothetical protein
LSDKLPATTGKKLALESTTGVVKGLIGAIPWAGTALNEALFEVRSRLKQERLEKFVELLGETVEKLGEDAVRQETIRSPEFSDLLEDIMQNILKTHSEQKVRVFVTVMAATMCVSKLDDHDMRELYISVIGTLNESEMEILKNLYRFAEAAEKRRQSGGGELNMVAIDYTQAQTFGVPTENFKICFETLISKGLALDDSFGRFDARPRTFILPTRLATGLSRFIAECAKSTEHPISRL